MKLIMKIFAYILLVIMMIIFFLPKINLYYKAEELLENYKVVLSAELPSDSGFRFKISDGTLYFDDLVVAKNSEITITPLLVYNSVDVKAFSFSEDMKQFTPLGVDGISLRHSIFDPLHVKIQGSGDFGSLDGKISILDKNISLILTPSPQLIKQKPFWLRKMKKNSQGDYTYESTY
jgi:hypothetical protein